MPSQAHVAKYLLETGIRIQGSKLYADRVAVSHSQVAAALGKDKRIVTSTVRTIENSPRLQSIYSKLKPSCNLIEVAPEMGWGIIEITLSDPALPGILGKVTTAIGETGVSIRQIIGEDPVFTMGTIFIITESVLPGFCLEKLRDIDGVVKITLH